MTRVLGFLLLLVGVIGRGPTTGLGRIFEPPTEIDVGDELAAAYADDAQERGQQVESGRPFLDWSADVPEPKRPLDLDRFRFQRALYSYEGEHAKLIRVIKAAQVGVSAWLIRWSLRRADLGNTVLYVMPRERQATEFSTLRINPVVRASRYLRARQKLSESPSDTKRLKTIGAGALTVRGSTSEDELISVDADALALDEFDRLVQANLPRVMQRVTNPLSAGLVREVSTPTFPNMGMAKGYEASDKRRWFVPCTCHERWHPLKGIETFVELLDHERAVLNDEGRQIDGPPIRLRCPHNGHGLDVRQGEWVAEHTDGTRPIGYHMPKFIVPGIDLAGVVHRSKATSEVGRRAFHNEDLGEGWQAEDAGLTDEQLAAATRTYRMDGSGYRLYKPVTMGIDVAASRALNVRISEHLDEHTKRALWIGEVDDGRAPWGAMPGKSAFEILTEMMARFRVHMAVIDHMPDPRLARAWCERFRGRAYRVSWSENQKAVLARTDPKGDPTKLTARYLEGIDATLDLVRRQANLLPEDRPDVYDAHMKARVLSTVESDEDSAAADRRKGGTVRSTDIEVRQAWIKTGPDDFLQAEAYDVIASHMMYVHHAQGGLAAADGQLVASTDLVDAEQEWQAAPADDLDYSEGPDEEPLGGW